MHLSDSHCLSFIPLVHALAPTSHGYVELSRSPVRSLLCTSDSFIQSGKTFQPQSTPGSTCRATHSSFFQRRLRSPRDSFFYKIGQLSVQAGFSIEVTRPFSKSSKKVPDSATCSSSKDSPFGDLDKIQIIPLSRDDDIREIEKRSMVSELQDAGPVDVETENPNSGLTADELATIHYPRSEDQRLTAADLDELTRPEKVDYVHRVACEDGSQDYVDPDTGEAIPTAISHLLRGFCCEQPKCRHCPYGFESPGVFREVNVPVAFQGIELRASSTTCPGCGAPFQSESEKEAGYLSEKKMGELEELIEQGRMAVCQRCYQLKHYGKLAPLTMHPSAFRRQLDLIRRKDCVVVKLVDIFDFEGSFLSNLAEIVGNNPVILVANKADLLPAGVKQERVLAWLHRAARDMGMRELWSIHLVSSQTGRGVDQLVQDIDYASRGRDVFVIGSANVGKSTLINRILKVGGGAAADKLITTSPVPGTTLNLISIPMSFSKTGGGKGSGGRKGPKRPSTLFDTPGLLLEHQLTRRLTPDELKMVIPRKQLKPVTFRIEKGKSLLFGAFARLDHVDGAPILVTCFFAPEVTIHPTNIRRAAEIIDEQVGDLLSPPTSKQRLKDLGALEEHPLRVTGDSWDVSCCDVVYSGLGWVALTTGAGPVRISAWAPAGVQVVLRPPLMPYEDKAAVKLTGAGLRRIPKAKPKTAKTKERAD